MKMRRTQSNSTEFEVITGSEVKSCAVGHGDPLHDVERSAALLRGMKRSLHRSRYRRMVEGTGYILHDRTVDLWWGGYKYSIDLDEIDSPQQLIRTLAHIGQKTWPGMTPARISALIQVLDKRFGWDMWGRAAQPK